MLMTPPRLAYSLVHLILGPMLRIAPEYACLGVLIIPLARIRQGNVLRDVISGVLSLIILPLSVLRHALKIHSLILAQ